MSSACSIRVRCGLDNRYTGRVCVRYLDEGWMIGTRYLLRGAYDLIRKVVSTGASHNRPNSEEIDPADVLTFIFDDGRAVVQTRR